MEAIRKSVEVCKKCGENYGNSATGFGKINKPLIFFVGMNPWVKNHKFNDGRGITILKRKFQEWGFEDFYLDNIVKCEIPSVEEKPSKFHIQNCLPYLKEQINLVNPKNIVCFGWFASKGLIDGFNPWGGEIFEFQGIRTITVPHFSAPLYGGEKSIKNYYERLEALINELKRDCK